MDIKTSFTACNITAITFIPVDDHVATQVEFDCTLIPYYDDLEVYSLVTTCMLLVWFKRHDIARIRVLYMSYSM